MKIGIYTIHEAYNYGAMLQAYATQKSLSKMGFNAEIVNYYPKEDELKNEYKNSPKTLKSLLINIYSLVNYKIKLKFKYFRQFHNSMNLSKRYYSLEEIYDKPPQYDIHLVGSDQVWNLERGFAMRNYYYLDFLKRDEKKISYGSSFGCGFIDPKYRNKLRQLLSSFDAISVREKDGVSIINSLEGLRAIEVMDPTFLLSQDDWSDLAGDVPLIDGKYILAYGFIKNKDSEDLIEKIRIRMGLPIIGISSSLIVPFKYDKFYQDAGPEEFLNLIKYSQFVITSSYHGAVFAIHFRKSFFITKHLTRNSRMESMLSKLGLIERQITSSENIQFMSEKELFIDYSIVSNKIKNEIEISLGWLKDTINNIK